MFELKQEPQNKKTRMLWQLLNGDRQGPRKNGNCCMNGKKPGSRRNTMMHDYEVIGRVPKLMVLWLTKFFKRSTNSGKVVVNGNRVNRGGSYLWPGNSLQEHV